MHTKLIISFGIQISMYGGTWYIAIVWTNEITLRLVECSIFRYGFECGCLQNLFVHGQGRLEITAMHLICGAIFFSRRFIGHEIDLYFDTYYSQTNMFGVCTSSVSSKSNFIHFTSNGEFIHLAQAKKKWTEIHNSIGWKSRVNLWIHCMIFA